jgi:hypothetical protein
MDSRPPETYPIGRLCCECDVPLSRYNPSGYCALHTKPPDWHYCGYDVVVCAGCGEAVILQYRGGDAVPSKSCRSCGATR